MRDILSSSIWKDYECGVLQQEACYEQIALQFSVSAVEVAEAFNQARESLQPNLAMVSFIHDLKHRSQEGIRVYAMSNISKEDYAVLSTKLADWSVFNQVFTSGHAGMRKPDPRFFQHVLRKARLTPEEVLFVDDKMENVMAAKSLGIDGIVFDIKVANVHTLRTKIYSPVHRAVQYLHSHSQNFDSVTDTGVRVPDNFAHLLILDALRDQYVYRIVIFPLEAKIVASNVMKIVWGSRRTWNFFRGNLPPLCSRSWTNYNGL